MLTCNDNSMEMLIKKEDYTADPNKVRFAHSNCYAEDYDDTYLKISTDFDKCNTTVTVRFVLIIREPSPENVDHFGSTHKGDYMTCILSFVFSCMHMHRLCKLIKGTQNNVTKAHNGLNS